MKKISFLTYLLPAFLGVVLLSFQSCDDEVDLSKHDYTQWGTLGTAKPSPSVPVEKVEFANGTYQVSFGRSIALTPVFTPDNASNRAFILTSDDTDIVTVDGNNVFGVSKGSATITATTADGGYTATCIVEVIIVPINSLILSEGSLLLVLGETSELSLETSPANGSILDVTWEALLVPEDPEDSETEEIEIVTIDNGLVTAVAIGETYITVIVNGNFTAACKVKVIAAPALPDLAGLTINNAAPRIEWRSATAPTFDFTLAFTPENALIDDVVWEIDDAGVATLAPNATNPGTAKATAVANNGKATVTAYVNGLFKATATIEVFFVPITSIDVADKEVEAGKTIALSIVTTPADATILTTPAVTWASDNTDIATVNASGTVTGVAPGEATITTTARGWDEDRNEKTVTTTATVKVTYVALTSVALNDGKPLTIEIGSSTSLGVAYTPEKATIKDKGTEWKTSNDEIVSVKDGKITALSLGTAVITAIVTDANGDKKEASCEITVVKRRQ